MATLKYPHRFIDRVNIGSMPSPQPQRKPTEPAPAAQPCRHPRVQIVARDEDSEFVECLECREVFESSEFKDMAIEESTPDEE